MPVLADVRCHELLHYLCLHRSVVMAMIHLRFCREKGFQPWLVRTYTWYPFDHVELALPYGYLGARPIGGVQVRPLDYLKPESELFATIDCPDNVQRRVLEFCKEQIGKPYDWTAIYGIVAHRDWQEPDKWICSELIAAAFEAAEYPLLNGDNVNRFSPRDIAISPDVEFQSCCATHAKP